jgi:hypothetical protein
LTVHAHLTRAPRAVAFGLLALLAPGVSHAAPADPFPPPGLYRLDHDSTVQQRGSTVHSVASGVEGSGFIEQRSLKDPSVRQTLAPGAPVTICMPARAPNTTPLPRSGCKALGKMVSAANGTSFGMQCGGVRLTTVITRLDAKTWQYKTTSVEELGGAGAALPDFATQRKMFEQTAKNGVTPEERADAASVLKNWNEYVAEARSAASEEEDTPRRSEQRSATSVTRYTRIADSCNAVPAKPAPR